MARRIDLKDPQARGDLRPALDESVETRPWPAVRFLALPHLTWPAQRCIFIVDTGFVMKTRVQKWGNSLALRIPKSFAAEAGLQADSAVELSLVKGKLVVQRVAPKPLTLEQLLSGITDENLPGEWDTGPAVGKEVW